LAILCLFCFFSEAVLWYTCYIHRQLNIAQIRALRALLPIAYQQTTFDQLNQWLIERYLNVILAIFPSALLAELLRFLQSDSTHYSTCSNSTLST